MKKEKKEMAKKVHWTQTPEGTKKMARAQKKSWRTRRATSKAERVVKRKVGKQAVPNRAAQYERIAKMAVAAAEVPKLMQALASAVFIDRWLGGSK